MPADPKPLSNRIGQVLQDKWVIERLVGEGGMASVYAARHRNGAVVALKILHPEISQREDIRERFLLEARAANRVPHAGVVKVHDDNVAQDGAVFLVMELLEGETVLDRANRALVAPDELLRWMDEVLDVLAAAHAVGVIHRDLKPDNIFLTSTGQVKVLDFGIARVSDALPRNFRTRTGIALGTGPYMSPEQALGKLGAIDGRSDLFSVGATMFRLLTRRRVHEFDKEPDLLRAMATTPAPPMSSVAPQVPRGVAAIIDRALAFLPSRRYPDARTMQADVRAVVHGHEPAYAMAELAAGREPWATHENAAHAGPLPRGVPATLVDEPPMADGAAPAPALAPTLDVPAQQEPPPWERPANARARAVPATLPDEPPSLAAPARVIAPLFDGPSAIVASPQRGQPPSLQPPTAPQSALFARASADGRTTHEHDDRAGHGAAPVHDRRKWQLVALAIAGFAVGFGGTGAVMVATAEPEARPRATADSPASPGSPASNAAAPPSAAPPSTAALKATASTPVGQPPRTPAPVPAAPRAR